MKNVSVLLAFTLSLLACGKKDIDRIGEAQSCLDTATAATANQCIEKVDGLESTQSFVIRCAATFIAEGFDQPARLTEAYKNMNSTTGDGSGVASSIAAMTALAFNKGASKSANQTLSNTNMGYCNKSASKGLILLSGIANMATNLLAFASCSTIGCAMQEAQANPAAQAAVGQAAIAAYTSNCTDSQNTNQQFCSQFQAAVTSAGGTSNPSAVGSALITQYCSATPNPCI